MVEDEPQNELDYDELKEMLHNEQATQPCNEPRVVGVDDDDDDDNGQGNGFRDSDDEDDLMMYPEGLNLSSFGYARREHTSGYCNEFDSGDE